MAKNRNTENTEVAAEVEATPEKVVDPKVEAKKEARKAAKVRVREFIKSITDNDELKADLILLVGSGTRAGRGPVRSINNVLKEAIVAAGEDGLTEMDIFKQFKIGRPEMTTKIRIFLKTPNVDDRVWVSFNEEDETYRVVGTGANAPEGWDGFVPADENVL
jgi:hypothetical protein